MKSAILLAIVIVTLSSLPVISRPDSFTERNSVNGARGDESGAKKLGDSAHAQTLNAKDAATDLPNYKAHAAEDAKDAQSIGRIQPAAVSSK